MKCDSYQVLIRNPFSISYLAYNIIWSSMHSTSIHCIFLGYSVLDLVKAPPHDVASNFVYVCCAIVLLCMLKTSVGPKREVCKDVRTIPLYFLY